MRTRRGTSVLASDLSKALLAFSPGDIVTSVIAGSIDFIGKVTRIDQKCAKVFVDWGSGVESQHGPEEIQLALFRGNDAKEKLNITSGRRGQLAEEDVPSGDQFVGDPKTHGIDEPRGGGFSIMQNLQKDLAPESKEEAEDGPKIARERSRVAAITESITTTWNDDGSIDRTSETHWDDDMTEPEVGAVPVMASRRSRYPFEEGHSETGRAGASERVALTVPQKHQKNIAIKTLQMSDVGARVMGGMTKDEAREFLKSIGWSTSKIRRLEASDRRRTAAAGPYTLLVELNDDLKRGRLENDDKLRMWGHGMGHTKGADYIIGDAGNDIVFVLLDYDSGRKDKDDVLRVVKKNIRQALKDNEVFKGMRAENVHDAWMAEMKRRRRGSVSERARRATVFPTQDALDKYLKQHPKADKSKHRVRDKDNPYDRPAPRTSPGVKNQMEHNQKRRQEKKDKFHKQHPETKDLDGENLDAAMALSQRAAEHAYYTQIEGKGEEARKSQEEAEKAIKKLEDAGHGDIAKSVAQKAWKHQRTFPLPPSETPAKEKSDKNPFEKKSSDYSQLRSRRALYWGDKGRVYRVTRREQQEGTSVCPKCKGEMEQQPFTKSEKLVSCPGCGFKIPSSKLITERPKVEVEVSPDGEVEVEVATARRGRWAADVPGNLRQMSIREIASLIAQDWTRVNYGAKPYLEAMFSLDSIDDNYIMDSGKSIVAYFLSNATTWRGEVAKAVKKELKRRLK